MTHTQKVTEVAPHEFGRLRSSLSVTVKGLENPCPFGWGSFFFQKLATLGSRAGAWGVSRLRKKMLVTGCFWSFLPLDWTHEWEGGENEQVTPCGYGAGSFGRVV